MRKYFYLFVTGLILAGFVSFSLAGRGKNPTVGDTGRGRIVVLPEDVARYLAQEFPGYIIPADTEFNADMLKYYYSRLIGIHPAIAWGDFNDDKKRDYALLLGTGQTIWGPIVELVILNGGKKSGEYEPFRLGELNRFKNDYISFVDGKLTKGEYKKGGWYINWIKKDKKYVAFKT
ncbi:MAG: hypothetical protein LHV69_11860 [Elusimicrobia bacterium]|nr:hypothetical protein [Candidatus Obscuribacterium magneticum]